MLGATVGTELAPAGRDIVEFTGTDFARLAQYLGEVVEVPPPVAVADGQEQVFLRGEVLVDGAFGVTGGVGDVIESRRGEALFGKHRLGSVQKQRPGVLQAALACPPLNHAVILPRNLRY